MASDLGFAPNELLDNDSYPNDSNQQVNDETCKDTAYILPEAKAIKEKAKHKGTSELETLMHMIKANIGAGVLAMPLAFKNAGLILGSVSLWIMAVICVHCMHILLKCYTHVMISYSKQTDSDKISDNIGYDDVVFLVFKEKYPCNSKIPKYFRILVSIFLILSQLGFCCVYLVFVPTNLKQIIDYYYPNNTLSVQILMCIILLPMILFCLIKNLKILAPFSTVANSVMFISIFIIMYELCFNGSFKELKELDMVAPFANWPTYYSSTIYAFEGISLVLPVHHEMKKKERFSPWNGVLNVAMAMVSIMYFSIGFFGYLKYGHDSAASVTLNLPVSDVLCQIVKILFSIGIFISYNLQFYVAADIIWSFMVRSIKYLKSLNESPEFETESVNKDVKKSAKKILSHLENVFRSCLVIFTFLLAISIPRIDLFISLIGALASSTLAIVIPPCLDMIVFWNTENKSILKLVKNVLIILFGIYIFIAGTYVSISDIVTYFKS